jgi:hypothetical protein
MNMEVVNQRRYPQIPEFMKWTMLIIFVAGLIAGAATFLERFVELSQLAKTYYHPYLVAMGLSDDFFIWYFLLTEGFLALVFAVVALIIALHRPATWITLFTGIALILFGMTVPPPLHSMILQFGELSLSHRIERAAGLALFIIFLYIFPDGRFINRWTKVLAVILGVWSLVWPFYRPLNPYTWHHLIPFLVISGWCVTGVLAQIHRYIHVSNAELRQQTKWVVFGVTLAVLGDFITHFFWYLFPLQKGPDCLFLLLHHPFFIVSQLILPIAIGSSLLRYGLWEADQIVYQTLAYTLMTTLVAAVWAGSTKLLEEIFKLVVGKELIPVAAGLAVFVAGATFGTTRQYIDSQIKRYFRIEKINFGKNFIEFLPEALASNELPQLLLVLVSRVSENMHSTHAVVFLYDTNKELQQAASHNIIPKDGESLYNQSLTLNDSCKNQLQKGEVVVRQNDNFFPFLVPLTLSWSKTLQMGILAFGPRSDGRGLSHDEISSLKQLGKEAGTAIYIAQINTENQRKLKQQLAALEERYRRLKKRINQNQ